MKQVVNCLPWLEELKHRANKNIGGDEIPDQTSQKRGFRDAQCLAVQDKTMYNDDVKLGRCLTVSIRIIGAKHAPPVGDLSMRDKKIDQTPSFPQSATALPIKKYAAACDRRDKSNPRDETPRGREPGELAVAAKERERVLAESAEEIRKLGKRAGADVIEIGRRLTETKKICGHGNWLPWLQREFGWTDRHALKCMQVYELSLKSENFSDLGIPVSGLYLLAAPSTPPEAVEEVIECAKSGERLTQVEIKGKIGKIKRVKATAAGITPGSSKKRTKAGGPTAPEQIQPEATILLPDAVKSMLLDIAIYVVERDGRVDPNDDNWMLLVLRAKAMFVFEAEAAGLLPVARI